MTDTKELHPGSGFNVFGGRVQLTRDGAKLFWSDAGLLYNTNGAGVLPLGIRSDGFSTDPYPAVFDGLFGASMNSDAVAVIVTSQAIIGRWRMNTSVPWCRARTGRR